MKKYIFLFTLSLLAFSFTGCKDFFDVNERTDTVAENKQEIRLLLPSVEYHIATLEYGEAYSAGQIQQHIASYFTQGVDQHYETSMSSVWTNYYASILYPLNRMDELADAKNAVHYKGLIAILRALSLGMTTDIYGDMPYSDAGLGSANYQPTPESQQALYAKIQSLLDSGIAKIDAQDDSGLENVPGDVFYHGDLAKWKRLAYTLKARYAMHLTKRNGAQAAQDALTYLANGFTSNDDDLQIFFNEKNKNPWHTAVVLSANTGNLSVLFSEQIVNYMNATVYPTAMIDPRLPDYVDNGGAATYDGAVNGAEGNDANGNGANTSFNGNGYYFQEDSPLVLVTYAEAKFLKAEAAFLANGGTTTSTGSTQDAYDAYLAGMSANMDKIGVDSVDRDAYLADPVIAVTPAGLQLQHIMKEKYIALLLNPEVFIDLRRYDFSTDVYLGLAMPVDPDPDMNGEWPRRAIYPTAEVDSNPNIDQVGFADRVWWDQ